MIYKYLNTFISMVFGDELDLDAFLNKIKIQNKYEI